MTTTQPATNLATTFTAIRWHTGGTTRTVAVVALLAFIYDNVLARTHGVAPQPITARLHRAWLRLTSTPQQQLTTWHAALRRLHRWATVHDEAGDSCSTGNSPIFSQCPSFIFFCPWLALYPARLGSLSAVSVGYRREEAPTFFRQPESWRRYPSPLFNSGIGSVSVRDVVASVNDSHAPTAHPRWRPPSPTPPQYWRYARRPRPKALQRPVHRWPAHSARTWAYIAYYCSLCHFSLGLCIHPWFVCVSFVR